MALSEDALRHYTLDAQLTFSGGSWAKEVARLAPGTTSARTYCDEHAGLGIWITTERATGTRLGFHLLNHIRGESIVQIGFTLAKSAWGQGFGTEMASAVLRYGSLT